eukprot:scaffold3198_cov213-Alexandrium_tamarense.AAC.31
MKMKNVQVKIKNTERKLKILEKMKDEFVKHHGEGEYKKKRIKLLRILVDAGDKDDVSNAAEKDDGNDDEPEEKNGDAN